MKFELDLVKAAGPDPELAGTNGRKVLREVTDRMIVDSLQANSMSQLIEHTGRAMVVVATILTNAGQEPEVFDFVEAAQALIEDGRAVMDRGIMIDSGETLLCGAVMLELACRGICAALSIPYETTFRDALGGGSGPEAGGGPPAPDLASS